MPMILLAIGILFAAIIVTAGVVFLIRSIKALLE